jgi:hypothetical protein
MSIHSASAYKPLYPNDGEGLLKSRSGAPESPFLRDTMFLDGRSTVMWYAADVLIESLCVEDSMNIPAFFLTKRLCIPLIAATTIATVAISIYFLRSGLFIVFQNLFYIPIILSCMFYAMRGFFLFSVSRPIVSPIGVRFCVRKQPHDAGDGEGCIFIVVAGVVTLLSMERERQEMARRENELVLRSLVNATDESLFLSDTQGRILVANEVTIRLEDLA